MLKQEEYLTDLVTWLVFIQYVVHFCTSLNLGIVIMMHLSLIPSSTVDTRKHSHASAAMLLNCTYTYANKMSLVKRHVHVCYLLVKTNRVS